MRVAPIALFASAACIVLGCALQQPASGDAGTAAAAATGDGGVDSSLTGGGCGIESGSGVQLCAATTACPNVVVDTMSFPHCGFRIRGGISELICACTDQICSMGAFTTCAQAAQLLTSQTEQQVCSQVAEGRCTAAAPAAAGSSGTSGTSGSSSNPTCDHTCLMECGSGAGCNSICGC